MLHPHGLRKQLYYTSDFKIDKPRGMKKILCFIPKDKKKKSKFMLSHVLLSDVFCSRLASHVSRQTV